MRLKGIEEEVLTNSTAESSFAIHATAKAFQILSDGLYEHKITAIVRELTCNAYDAHVEAGNADQPFRINFPNKLHPLFEIEDFGIGLDEEGVRSVYTGYFNSTKTDSNEAIGAFGLGSKTPFAYTSSYSIIARKHGTERVFKAYIGSSGAPQINLMTTRQLDDDEPQNGVKVSIPVRESDYRQFVYEAEFLMSFFAVRPITNIDDFDVVFPTLHQDLAQRGYASCQPERQIRSSLYQGVKQFAVMGGVPYPASLNTYNEDWWNDYAKAGYQLANSSYDTKCFARFDIGDLDITASRESLSLDDQTMAAVNTHFANLFAKFADDVQEEVDQCTHPIEAFRMLSDKYDADFTRQFKWKNKHTVRVAVNKGSLWTTQPSGGFFKSPGSFALKPHYGGTREINDIDLNDVRAATSNFSEGQKAEITIIYNKNPKTKGRLKFAREETKKHRGRRFHFVISMSEKPSDRVIERFHQYTFDTVDLKLLALEDLKDEDKKNKAQNPVTASVAREPLEIDACTWRFGDAHSGSRHRFDVDPTKHVFVMRDGDDRGAVYLSYDHSTKEMTDRFSEDYLGEFFHILGPDYVIVFGTRASAPRLVKHQVPLLIDKVRERMKGEGAKGLRQAIARRTLSIKHQVHDTRTRLLIQGGDETVRKLIDIDKLKRWSKQDPGYSTSISLSPRGIMDNSYNLIPQYLVDAYNNSFDVENQVEEHIDLMYPMIDFVSPYSFNDADVRSQILDYIKQVISYQQMLQQSDDTDGNE